MLWYLVFAMIKTWLFLGSENFYKRDCFYGELMIPNQWGIFKGVAWTPSNYYDIGGIGDVRYGKTQQNFSYLLRA